MATRRLEAEALRDAMLAVSGQLDADPAGRVAGGPGRRRTVGRWLGCGSAGRSTAADTHRSVYLPVVRDHLPEALALFDFADAEPGDRRAGDDDRAGAGAVPVNSPFVIRAGRRGRRAAAREVPDDAAAGAAGRT